MKKVVLFANLGSPDSCEVGDVRKYLREFLMDGRVIDIPAPVRFFLVNGIIAPFRAPESASKYKTIWTSEGSPLICLTKAQTEMYEQHSGVAAYFCMRYGNPDPKDVLKQIHRDHPDLEEVQLLPMYPHYAMSSYETAVVDIRDEYKKGGYKTRLTVVPAFYNHPVYIDALAASISEHMNEAFDHLLFSYHGIPVRHLIKTDPTKSHCQNNGVCCATPSEAHNYCYRHQVMETTRLTAQKLGLREDQFSYSFQSRLGNDKWLLPETAQTLRELPGKGVKKLLIVTPAFISDCLETLEEIRVEGKETFMHAGGSSYITIPCLNTRPEWISAIDTLLKTAQP